MKTLYHSRIVLLAFFMITAFFYHSNATKHIVTVENFSFTPSSLSINLGDTMEWKFVSGSHTTTSTTIPAGAASWNNSIDGSHLKFDYVPAVTGTYNYHCNIHPTTMIASFTVVCAAPSVTISAGGPTTFCVPGSVVLSKSSAGSFTSFQWKKGAANIAGATNSTFTATKSGVYKLVATNGCGTATSNAINVTANATPPATVTPAGPINLCQGQTAVLTANSGSNLTYQWKKGNNNIAGATNHTLTVGAAGNYKVTVTNSVSGCFKLSKAVKVSITCKKLLEENTGVTAYPNPTVDYFLINTSSLTGKDAFVNIYDITGKLLERNQVTGSSMEAGKNLNPGFYIARIEMNGEFTQVLKLIKNQ